MPFEPLESKRIYVHAEEIGDRIWDVVLTWEWFAKKTVGMQLVEAADSVGANIAESGGRFHPNDVRNFLYHSRGSLRETIYWLRRAHKRKLLDADTLTALVADLEQLSREINECINFQKTRAAANKPSSRSSTT
jgi:four helix bundle protein